MIGKAEYYTRQVEQWGSDKQNILSKKKIAIIGSGGLGCSLGFALSGIGLDTVDVVDFDTVSVSNLHRQIAFGVEDVGKYKSRLLVERIKERNPFVKSNAFVMNFEEFTNLGNSYDLILDATDNYETRLQIDLQCKSDKNPWIYASVEGYNGQLCFFHKSNFDDFNHTAHEPRGIAAPMVMQIASMEANMAVRYLSGDSVHQDKLHYVFYDESGELVIKKFDMPI